MKQWGVRFWQLIDVLRGPCYSEGLLDNVVETVRGTLLPPGARILFVGLKFDYGFVRRGYSYERNNFVHCLASMGFEVLHFDTGIRRRLGRRQMNRLLWETVIRYRPALLFAVLFKDELDPEVVTEISQHTGTTTLNWFCDDHWRFDTYSAGWAPRFNWVVTTYRPAVPRYHQLGCQKVILSQWACNHFLYRCLNLPKRYEVSFIGQPHGNRPHVIRSLRRAGIPVHTWGFGWPRGRLTQAEMIRVINETKICLNLSNASREAPDQIKGRDFEVPGCGGFLITGQVEGIEDHFKPGEEMVCYSTVDELVDFIKYYLNHEEERERIAERGYQRVLREHTYAHRLGDILERIGIYRGPRDQGAGRPPLIEESGIRSESL